MVNKKQIQNDIANFGNFGNWYKNCKNAMINKYGTDWRLFAKLLASTSPRQAVKRNVQLAKNCMNSDFTGLMPCHISNVKRCFSGHELSGDKVRAFYENLIGNMDKITVDVWMFRYFNLKPSKKNYAKIEKRIKYYAKMFKLKPAILQAILWTAIRWRYGKKPVSFHYFIANEQLKLFNV